MAGAIEGAMTSFATIGQAAKQVKKGGAAGYLRPEIVEKLKTNTSSVWFDGDATIQKAGRLCLGTFWAEHDPHQGRDEMHEAVNLFVDALYAVEETAEIRRHLVLQRKAHENNICYSDRYKDAFVTNQQTVLDAYGVQGGDLKSILSSVSWARRRKLSEQQVYGNICLTFIASVATVSDESVNGPDLESKNAAEETFRDVFTVTMSVLMGMMSDYLACCSKRKKETDADITNPSTRDRLYLETLDTMNNMFVKGEVLGDLGESSMTQIVLQQMRDHAGVFRVKNDFHAVGCSDNWKTLPFAQAALAVMRKVVRGLEEMIKIFLGHPGLENAIGCFDVVRWHDCFKQNEKMMTLTGRMALLWNDPCLTSRSLCAF